MSTETYAQWNPNACDASLVLSGGNTIVTTGADALSSARKVLSTLPRGVGDGISEHEFYTVPLVNLGDTCAIGLAQSNSSLNTGVGVDALSIGYYPGTGIIRSNNATVGTIDIIDEVPNQPHALRKTISILIKFITGTPHFVVAINGSWQIDITLPTGKLWCVAATLSGGKAAETFLNSNFGNKGALKFTRIGTIT